MENAVSPPRDLPLRAGAGAEVKLRVPRRALAEWVEAVLIASGLAPADAALGAERLLLADAIGVGTHGIARLPTYWGQLRSGVLKPDADVRVRTIAGVLVVEGDRGLGQVIAARALDAAAERLFDQQAFVPFLIRDAGHLGALGCSVLPLARAGLVAFLSQNSAPVMAPRGAKRPAIGNNPIAFAAPRPDGPPLLIDFAASVVARGNVLAAAREGKPLAPGWAIDSQGNETLDPQAALAGAVLPTGGHKGLALAMIVETLAGALTGTRPADAPGGAAAGCGAFGFVLDPARLSPGPFPAHMADWTAAFLACGAEGTRIPGARAAHAEAEANRHGIPLPPGLATALRAVGRDAGFPFPE